MWGILQVPYQDSTSPVTAFTRTHPFLRPLCVSGGPEGMMEPSTRSKMSKRLSVQTQLLTIFAALFLSAGATYGQASKDAFSSVVASGKVNGDVYQNSYFGIALSAPKARWKVRGPISVQRRQGRLIEA